MNRREYLEAATASIANNALAREERDELDTHLDALCAERLAQGWEPAAAEADALRRMGSPGTLRGEWRRRSGDLRFLCLPLLATALALQAAALWSAGFLPVSWVLGLTATLLWIRPRTFRRVGILEIAILPWADSLSDIKQTFRAGRPWLGVGTVGLVAVLAAGLLPVWFQGNGVSPSVPHLETLSVYLAFVLGLPFAVAASLSVSGRQRAVGVSRAAALVAAARREVLGALIGAAASGAFWATRSGAFFSPGYAGLCRAVPVAAPVHHTVWWVQAVRVINGLYWPPLCGVYRDSLAAAHAQALLAGADLHFVALYIVVVVMLTLVIHRLLPSPGTKAGTAASAGHGSEPAE